MNVAYLRFISVCSWTHLAQPHVCKAGYLRTCFPHHWIVHLQLFRWDWSRHQMECHFLPLCWFHLFLYHLSRYLTFQHMYFTFYRWKPNTRGQALSPSATDVHAAINYLEINFSIAGSTNTQWKSTVSKMTHIWTVVVLGATLFLPSVLIN